MALGGFAARVQTCHKFGALGFQREIAFVEGLPLP
jgi:hypothetical protein